EERENAECNPMELEPNARPRFYPGKTGVLKKERSAGPPRSNQMLPQHAHHQPGINEPEHDPEKKRAKRCRLRQRRAGEVWLRWIRAMRKLCRRAPLRGRFQIVNGGRQVFPRRAWRSSRQLARHSAAITGATKVVRAVRIWAAQAASEYRLAACAPRNRSQDRASSVLLLVMRFRFIVAVWICVSCGPAQTQVADFAAQRERMVKEQIVMRGLVTERVLSALRKVPREEFVPAEYRAESYTDKPLPIGYDQTISQPFIVVFMTEASQPQRTDRVLEVGTGSGYQAA